MRCNRSTIIARPSNRKPRSREGNPPPALPVFPPCCSFSSSSAALAHGDRRGHRLMAGQTLLLGGAPTGVLAVVALQEARLFHCTIFQQLHVGNPPRLPRGIMTYSA